MLRLRILGKYVAVPAAGIGMLAGLGVLDLGPSQGSGGGSGGLTSAGDAAGGILSALEGPLSVARNIAAAGGAQLGLDPGELPDFLTGDGGAPLGGPAMGSAGYAGTPGAQRKTVGAPGAPAEDAGDRPGPILRGGGGWKSSRPPASPAE